MMPPPLRRWRVRTPERVIVVEAHAVRHVLNALFFDCHDVVAVAPKAPAKTAGRVAKPTPTTKIEARIVLAIGASGWLALEEIGADPIVDDQAR